jgi:hypothetical protein
MVKKRIHNLKIMSSLPSSFPVKLGNSRYKMKIESLINSICHQYLNKHQKLYNFEHYDILFNTVKLEIEKFLIHKIENGLKFFDFFDEWQEEFQTFQVDKNKFLCKDFIIEFSDKSKWSIRLLDLLSLRYNGEDISEDDPFVKDEAAIINWVRTLNWDDILPFAEEIKRPEFCPDYNDEIVKADVEIVPWDKSINLLDLFESTLNDEQELD